MDFLTIEKESGFSPFSFTVCNNALWKLLQKRFCHLCEFEEIEISRQSCRGDFEQQGRKLLRLLSGFRPRIRPQDGELSTNQLLINLIQFYLVAGRQTASQQRQPAYWCGQIDRRYHCQAGRQGGRIYNRQRGGKKTDRLQKTCTQTIRRRQVRMTGSSRQKTGIRQASASHWQQTGRQGGSYRYRQADDKHDD